MLQFLVVLSFLLAVYSYSGVDVSSRVSTSSWQCLKSNGYHFAIVRVYQSNGKPDPNAPATINDAWAGGMSYVDGYIFPCYSCGNPAKQMDDALAALGLGGVKFVPQNETRESMQAKLGSEATLGATVGMIWIDVEGTQYWSSNQASNVNFIKAMADEGVKKGATIGIYTSNSQWSPITGGSTALSKYPLWYPHYDNNPSFSDFVPFGGWSKPNIKQYIGTTSICSASVDKNFY